MTASPVQSALSRRDRLWPAVVASALAHLVLVGWAVARPISEALIATAVGLFAAIPAVVAYNFFVSKIRVLDSEMTNFSADFLNIVRRHFFSGRT